MHMSAPRRFKFRTICRDSQWYVSWEHRKGRPHVHGPFKSEQCAREAAHLIRQEHQTYARANTCCHPSLIIRLEAMQPPSVSPDQRAARRAHAKKRSRAVDGRFLDEGRGRVRLDAPLDCQLIESEPEPPIAQPKPKQPSGGMRSLIHRAKWILWGNESGEGGAFNDQPNSHPVVGDDEQAQRVIPHFVAHMESLGIEVRFAVPQDNALGVFDPDDNSITLSPEQDGPSLVHTAAHELAHFHDPWQQVLPMDDYRAAPGSYEAVAALVAQQVCSRVGLNADRRTNAYLENWLRRSASRSKSDPALRDRALVASAAILDGIGVPPTQRHRDQVPGALRRIERRLEHGGVSATLTAG